MNNFLINFLGYFLSGSLVIGFSLGLALVAGWLSKKYESLWPLAFLIIGLMFGLSLFAILVLK
jgi:hypothetical protein